MYGAAYAPHLVTGIPFAYDDDIVTLGFKQIESGITDQNGLQILFDGTGPSVVIRTGDEVAFEVEDNGILNIYLKAPGPTQAAEIKSAWDALPAGAKKGFYINPLGAGGDISEASLTPTKIQGIYLDGTIPSAGSKIQIEYKGNDPSPQVVVNQGAFDIVESGNTLTITLEATTPTTTKISNILAKNTSLTNFEITKVDKSDPLKTPPSGDPNFGYPSAFTGPSQTIPVATLAYEWATGSPDGLKARYEGNAIPTVTIQQSGTPEVEVNGANLTIKNVGPQGVSPASVLEAWNKLGKTNQGQYSIRKSGSGDTVVTTGPAGADRNVPMTSIAATLDIIKDSNTQAYHAIKAKLDQEMMTLPPSSAIAGIYARVDGSRGVWKAPANVSVSNVLGPAEPITDEQQGRLNIDSTSGKSINAIRSFTGKGTLVWGARTLAGNSNEWRYISVRRLFITIEESVQKASAFAVFEPNDATTWLKVKAMIDNYLYGLWQQGALAGPKPESAYYVHVGLGKTMTTQDILEGRMNVEIGVAAVRPAEFIVLKFSHKMQEA
ncbi:MAG: phage tail sheath family protein [Lewinellaceae bacterium]|nr:phage tail sheath family protein [Phaeodactylibacter sp.]MCB9037325.1 phage tail sheath family protein [Lewinellaceae bacterium]